MSNHECAAASHDGGRISVRCVNTVRGFAALKDEWNAILEKSEARSVFLSWEWLYYWWLHFKGNKELFILVAETESGGIAGIAPFCIERAGGVPLIPVRTITFLGTEQVGSDFLDLIVPDDRKQEIIPAFYRYLADHEREWDVVELSDIKSDSPTIPLIERANEDFGLLKIDKEVCPYIPLPRSYDTYLRTLTTATRRELRRKIRVLKEDHGINFTVVERCDEIMAKLREVFRLHEEGFRAKYGLKAASAFVNDRAMRFHYDVIPHLARKRQVKLFFLNQRNRPIACSYAFHDTGAFFAYQSGFDGRWHALSPGTALIGQCVEWCIENGFREYHFLRGPESYKSRWAKDSIPLIRLSVVNRTLRGQVYQGYMQGKANIKNLAKNIPVPVKERMAFFVR